MVLSPQSKLEIVTGDRLESWKEISAYLNRSERTVRRWEEKEGMPVHRLHHEKRGSVYALRSELDGWRETRKPLVEGQQPASNRLGKVRWRWILGTGLSLAGIAGAFWLLRQPEPKANPRKRPASPEAARAAKMADFSRNPRRAQILSGIEHYQEAIRTDQHYGLAWIGLATAHQTLAQFGEVPPKEGMEQARSEAQTAVKLSSSQSGAWRVLGGVSHLFDWDHTAAESHFRKALELNPRDGTSAGRFAEYLIDLRRFAEASKFAQQAGNTAPLWLESHTIAGNVQLYSGDLDRAIEIYGRVLAVEPEHGLANHFLGRAYLAQRDYEKALQQLRKSNEILGQVPMSMGDLGYALGVAGNRMEAQKMLSGLVRRAEQGYYPAFAIARIHLGLGDKDAALNLLARAVDERNAGYYLPSVEPIFDPIREDPRFQSLLRRMNLPLGK